MKASSLLVLVIIVLMHPVSSVTASEKNSVNNSFVEQGKSILHNLDKTKNQGTGYDYWPDGGIQIAYDHLRTFMTYKDLVKLAPMPVFINNHHTKLSLDLKSNTAFGHYNPAFLDWLKIKLTAILKSPEFINATKENFEKYLAKTAMTYWAAYRALEKRPAERDLILNDYRDKINQEKLPNGYYYNLAWDGEKKFEFIKSLNEKYSVNVVVPAIYFWMRRKLDSTDEKMIALLEQLLKAYGKIN